MSKVFVSYAHQDSDIVYPLVMRLKGRGVPIWIDNLNIESGMHWDLAIEEALHQATHVLVVLSRASVQSKNVRDEIDLALDTKKIIVPIMINTCTRPMRIRRIQYTDFRENDEGAFDKLLKILPHDLNINDVTMTLPSYNIKDISGSEFLSFPEDRSQRFQGRNMYPTLIFQSMDGQDKRQWVMKFNVVYLGRESHCDIIVPVREVSRRHAKIVRAGNRFERYQILDLGSKNFTWINKQKIDANKPFFLKDGDVINLANVLIIEFQFKPGYFNQEDTMENPSV